MDIKVTNELINIVITTAVNNVERYISDFSLFIKKGTQNYVCLF